MSILRRRWPVIAVCVLVAASAAWIVTEATSEEAPLPSGSSTTFGATILLWDPGAEATGSGSPVTSPAALARVVEGPNVAPIAAEIMYFQGDPAQLLPRVHADVDPSTGYLRITGIGKDSASAQTIANAFSQGLIVYLARLQATKIDQERHVLQERIAALTESGAGPAAIQGLRDRLTQLSVKEATPVSLTELQRLPPTPRPLAAGDADVATGDRLWVPETVGSRVLLASLLGLLVGIVLALLLERFDTRIRSGRRAEEAFRLPVLAEVPAIPVGRRERVVTATHPYSRAANAFRLVQVGSARWAAPEGRKDGRKNGKNGKNGTSASRGATTILVTSAEARDGKTTVAANLAAAYAQAGNRVLVVSCDLRRPAIHEMFGVAEEPGLTDLLRSMESAGGSVDPAPFLKPCAVLRVAVLPSGSTTDRPSELLGSDAMRRLAKRLKKITDVVILDSAPLVVAGDVVPLISMVDGVVVVARAGKTKREVAASTTTLLERNGLGTRLRDPERRPRVLDPAGEAAHVPTGQEGAQGRRRATATRRGLDPEAGGRVAGRRPARSGDRPDGDHRRTSGDLGARRRGDDPRPPGDERRTRRRTVAADQSERLRGAQVPASGVDRAPRGARRRPDRATRTGTGSEVPRRFPSRVRRRSLIGLRAG